VLLHVSGTVTSQAMGLPLYQRKNDGAISSFAVLPHEAHWFFESMDLGALQESPDDVFQMVVVLLSWCTPPAGQTAKTPCINCLTTCTFVRLTRSAAKSALPHRRVANLLM